jgi:hypothetical protein
MKYSKSGVMPGINFSKRIKKPSPFKVSGFLRGVYAHTCQELKALFKKHL